MLILLYGNRDALLGMTRDAARYLRSTTIAAVRRVHDAKDGLIAQLVRQRAAHAALRARRFAGGAAAGPAAGDVLVSRINRAFVRPVGGVIVRGGLRALLAIDGSLLGLTGTAVEAGEQAFRSRLSLRERQQLIGRLFPGGLDRGTARLLALAATTGSLENALRRAPSILRPFQRFAFQSERRRQLAARTRLASLAAGRRLGRIDPRILLALPGGRLNVLARLGAASSLTGRAINLGINPAPDALPSGNRTLGGLDRRVLSLVAGALGGTGLRLGQDFGQIAPTGETFRLTGRTGGLLGNPGEIGSRSAALELLKGFSGEVETFSTEPLLAEGAGASGALGGAGALGASAGLAANAAGVFGRGPTPPGALSTPAAPELAPTPEFGPLVPLRPRGADRAAARGQGGFARLRSALAGRGPRVFQVRGRGGRTFLARSWDPAPPGQRRTEFLAIEDAASALQIARRRGRASGLRFVAARTATPSASGSLVAGLPALLEAQVNRELGLAGLGVA
ncbi:MAG: hypothetical protein AB7Q17_15855 [Phycisphaerae bacterium]